MQRLTYAPKAHVYIDSSGYGGVVDLTRDVISGSVNRRLNAMSTATFTVQNRNNEYINKFKPMDRISIFLERIGNPTLTFTGYLDEVPYYQMHPGPVTFFASDTLKLIQHTYFDPGLPYMSQWLLNKGWAYDFTSGTLLSPTSFFKGADIQGGVGKIIHDALVEIGGWNADHVKILNLPEKFIKDMTLIMFKELENDRAEFEHVLERLRKLLTIEGINPPQSHIREVPGHVRAGGSSSQGSSATTPASLAEIAKKKVLSMLDIMSVVLYAGWTGDKAITAAAVAMYESAGGKADVDNKSPACTSWPTGEKCLGLWQINGNHNGETLNGVKMSSANAKNPILATRWAYGLYRSGGNSFTPWEAFTNHAYKQYLDEAQAAYRQLANDSGKPAALPPGSRPMALEAPGQSIVTNASLAQTTTERAARITSFLFPLDPDIKYNVKLTPNDGDILCDVGTPVYAVQDGIVKSSIDTAGGNVISLDAGDVTWTYKHLDSLIIKSGVVKQGKLIAYSGQSGDAIKPHLSLEHNPNG